MVPVPVVLVVEDSAELRNALREALANEGYRVLATRDETEAMDVLRGTRVDLFISDLTEPPDTQKALEVVQKQFPELPVIALSEPNRARPAFFSGWQGPRQVRTLTKPFRLADLLAVAREILGPCDPS